MINQDEIIAMAKEAGAGEMGLNVGRSSIHLLGLFTRFAALVSAKEREACAQVCRAKAGTDGLDYSTSIHLNG